MYFVVYVFLLSEGVQQGLFPENETSCKGGTDNGFELS